jgi:AcrR family transcriptional regulator
VAEVAQSAGVSRATAYRYFPSRSKLVSAVIAEALVALRWHSHGGSAWPNDARA